MFAVERLGSYISRGVYTVSGPFHPFGGAVDIVVVEQQDGSFKSSPWYIRFGKFQGILKATEKVVGINVNGVDADFHMYLDHKGEAFFLREVDAAEGELEPYASSGDEMVMKSDLWRTHKSKSCNYDSNSIDLASEIDESNGKILARISSRKGRVFGLPLGRQSIKQDGFQDREATDGMDRVSSLERAEIAADLLEVRWTTNLRAGKSQSTSGSDENMVDSSLSYKDYVEPVCSTEESDAEFSCSSNPGNYMEIFTLEETYMGANLTSDKSNISNEFDNGSMNKDQNAQSELKSSSVPSQAVDTEGIKGSVSYGEEPSNTRNDAHLADEVATTPSNTGGSIEDINVKKEVIEVTSNGVLNLEDSIRVGPCKCSSGSINELCSEGLSTGAVALSSLPPPSNNESSTADVDRPQLSLAAEECLGDSTQEKNPKVTSSDDSEEEQFSFSDLNNTNVEKADQVEASSPVIKEFFSRDSLESSEDEVSETISLDGEVLQLTGKLIQDNLLNDHPSLIVNSNRVSSPISISKVHNDTDEEALAPTAESLPNMLFDADDLSLGVPQPLGCSLDSNLEAFKMVNNVVAVALDFDAGKQQVAHLQLTSDSSQIQEEIRKMVSDPAVEMSLCRHFLYEGMGYEAAALVFDAEKLDIEKFSSLDPDIVKNDKLVVRIGGLYFPWDAALPIASAIGSQGKVQIFEPKGMIAVGQVDNRTSEVAPKSMNSRSGSWTIWPFSFKRSNSMQVRRSDSVTAPGSPKEMIGNKDMVGPKVTKKKIWAKIPTSEQLAALNLKEGKNVVTFTFSTAMLGKQQVDARIFLWKWNARIVISDVDGTITKSDVLGQFMPLMGIDWSQIGVTHLFSSIKENGYQLLFLSARSISQAYHTRQFLFSLKQDGKALPEGPVVISPDGLFPSLYREVIRRAPHEFKIACLEDIKALFPPDHNPFYAGFGNRDTDEISYLKVGIPRGKIFTINPKGEVAVNRRVDTKSYTSLHALVHRMFPPTPVTEQEDYNSWNFWKLPPPDVI